MSEAPARIDRARIEEILRIAPFHAWLDLKVRSLTPQRLELEMPWRDEIVSNPIIGSAHGGVLASLIDLTGFYALIAQGTKVKATADLRVDYHRPATSGPLVATGLIVKVGQQISVAETSVTGPNEKLLDSGRGAYICGDL